MELLLPNDLRISCKRLARPALSYVPPPAIGGWRCYELSSDALVGCMRGLGSSPPKSHAGIVYAAAKNNFQMTIIISPTGTTIR
jgi:hypothetical protein